MKDKLALISGQGDVTHFLNLGPLLPLKQIKLFVGLSMVLSVDPFAKMVQSTLR